MFKLILKNTLAIALTALMCNVHAETIAKNWEDECLRLSSTVESLISSQERDSCIGKLERAAHNIIDAASLIHIEDNRTAKTKLDQAVYYLQYAELNSCNKYILIANSKFAAQRIKNSL